MFSLEGAVVEADADMGYDVGHACVFKVGECLLVGVGGCVEVKDFFDGFV